MAEDAELMRELEAARSLIASQAVQIHRLEQEAQGTGAIGVLRELIELSDIVSATVGQTPYRQLLNGITEAAKRLFDAGAASILLVDDETNELVFEAATGGGDVIGLRFPAHQGIAGWTVMSGEPIAVGDVRRDPRWASSFAASTGYVPKSILSVPMFLDEEVVGVMQVLDKASAAAFGLDDMELLGLFARPAAIAVQQARMVMTIGKLLTQELARMAQERGEAEVATAAATILANGSTSPAGTLELARLVHTISKKGDRYRSLALDVLTSVSRFTG